MKDLTTNPKCKLCGKTKTFNPDSRTHYTCYPCGFKRIHNKADKLMKIKCNHKWKMAWQEGYDEAKKENENKENEN